MLLKNMAAAAPKRVPSPWTWWCLQHQGGMLPLRECIGLKWPKGRWEIRRERARSSSRGNQPCSVFSGHFSFPSFGLWVVLALCPQEDGSAPAAGAPALEELYSEGESRPKEGGRRPVDAQGKPSRMVHCRCQQHGCFSCRSGRS